MEKLPYNILSRCRKNRLTPLWKSLPCNCLSRCRKNHLTPCWKNCLITSFRVVERIALLLSERVCLVTVFHVVERIALFLWFAFVHLSRCWKNRLIPLVCLCHLSRCWKNRLIPSDYLLIIFRDCLERIALFLWIARVHLSHCQKNCLILRWKNCHYSVRSALRVQTWVALLFSERVLPCFRPISVKPNRVTLFSFKRWPYPSFAPDQDKSTNLSLFSERGIALSVFRIAERVTIKRLPYPDLSRCRKSRLTSSTLFIFHTDGTIHRIVLIIFQWLPLTIPFSSPRSSSRYKVELIHLPRGISFFARSG